MSEKPKAGFLTHTVGLILLENNKSLVASAMVSFENFSNTSEKSLTFQYETPNVKLNNFKQPTSVYTTANKRQSIRTYQC